MAGTATSDPTASYEILWPAEWRVPGLLSVPHSGNCFPPDFDRQRSGGTDLSTLEDPFLDRLLPDTDTLGMPVLVAVFGRAYVDVNRSPSEWDQAMFSERLPARLASNSGRVKAGLGTFPRYLPPRLPVNRRRMTIAQGMQRWMSGYRPYHRALRHLLRQCRARFGYAFLLDFHSMPQLPGERLPDLVLGDGFGRACAAPAVQAANRAVQEMGLSVTRNYPYAGGYITQNYGRPAQGYHALQLEFSRPLYMDETSRHLKPQSRYVTQSVSAIAHALQQLEPSLLLPAPAVMAGED